MRLLHNNASRFWYFGLPRLEPGALAADIKGHLDVVASIKKGDAVAADRAMRNLLGHFPDNVRYFLSAGISRKERSDERDVKLTGGTEADRKKVHDQFLAYLEANSKFDWEYAARQDLERCSRKPPSSI